MGLLDIVANSSDEKLHDVKCPKCLVTFFFKKRETEVRLGERFDTGFRVQNRSTLIIKCKRCGHSFERY